MEKSVKKCLSNRNCVEFYQSVYPRDIEKIEKNENELVNRLQLKGQSQKWLYILNDGTVGCDYVRNFSSGHMIS